MKSLCPTICAGDVLTEDAVATNGATPGSNGASGIAPTPVTDSEGNISDASDDSSASVVSEGETTADESVASKADTASTTRTFSPRFRGFFLALFDFYEGLFDFVLLFQREYPSCT